MNAFGNGHKNLLSAKIPVIQGVNRLHPKHIRGGAVTGRAHTCSHRRRSANMSSAAALVTKKPSSSDANADEDNELWLLPAKMGSCKIAGLRLWGRNDMTGAQLLMPRVSMSAAT